MSELLFNVSLFVGIAVLAAFSFRKEREFAERLRRHSYCRPLLKEQRYGPDEATDG